MKKIKKITDFIPKGEDFQCDLLVTFWGNENNKAGVLHTARVEEGPEGPYAILTISETMDSEQNEYRSASDIVIKQVRAVLKSEENDKFPIEINPGKKKGKNDKPYHTLNYEEKTGDEEDKE